MTLLEEIHARCAPELIAAREHGQIAAIVSQGRTRPSTLTIGNGTVLEVLGLEAGNAFLDVIHANPAFRHVKPLLDQGRLIVGAQIVRTAILGMVPAGVLTQTQADQLLALGVEPDPVSVQAVVAAMEGL
ncbi:hypothetical protein [Hydrogenophaga sp.]|uniref:hypothetical protein n=1 Tax=Hydrogenophaga sp. TaxID=1904254 RepID=UPI003F722875